MEFPQNPIGRILASLAFALGLTLAAPAVAGGSLPGTNDVYYGPATGSVESWQAWHRELTGERERMLRASRFDPAIYRDPETAWSRHDFRQFFLFMYDESFYDRVNHRYRAAELLDEWRARFGGVDVVLLWHGYPRLGFDRRDQFAFYADMPGGLEKLKREVSDVLHARGVRVYLDYNPWDVSGDLENAPHRREYEKLAAIVGALDADGVMLDTLSRVPDSMRAAVARVKRGVVYSPEDRPPDADLSNVAQSWAQWTDRGDGRASIYRDKWLVPEHRQFAIRRWDLDRRDLISYSFFNGQGLLLWDNVFGAWNPYSPQDRRLIAETGAVLRSYAGLLGDGEWLPLVPTGVDGLDANLWRDGAGRRLLLLLNRTEREQSFDADAASGLDVAPGLLRVEFWDHARPGLNASERRISVPPYGVQAVAIDEPAHASQALAAFAEASRLAGGELPGYDERTPHPHALFPRTAAVATQAAADDRDLIALPGGSFTMAISHKRRECGCYPAGATDNAMWGYFEGDTISHKIDAEVKPFRMKRTTVTNAEYLEFVHATGYVPAEGEHFLQQLPRARDGRLPMKLSPELARLPVTYVSLDDARAYARWRGERLPSEAEWQWAAEGAGRANAWPWGGKDFSKDPRFVNLTGKLAAADANAKGATPQGLVGLTGNAWELTESEYSDGHTRFVMLRGGVYLPPAESGWIVARGPHPNGFHAKYLLLGDGLDRSAAVSFRTVR